VTAFGWTLLVAAIAAPPAAAQDPRLRDRLDAATASRIEQLTDSARRLGLPAEPLVLKALEGKSNGAPNGRIVDAVGLLLDALGAARTELGAGSSSEELVAGALWLRAGGDGGALATLRRAAPGRPLAVALAVSTELLSRGFSRAAAVESTSSLLAARVSDADFMTFRDRVEEAVRRGTGYDAAIRNEVARIQSGRRQP
jgi:hypothetical protein